MGRFLFHSPFTKTYPQNCSFRGLFAFHGACLFSNDSSYKQEGKEGLRTREKMNGSYRALLPGPDTNFGPVQQGKLGKGKTSPQTIQYMITFYYYKQAAVQFGHLKRRHFC